MKKLIILFFISTYCFCQNVDYIKKCDTIYISFTKKKNLVKNVYSDNYRVYRYYLKTEKSENQKHLLFEKPDRKNSITDKSNPIVDTRIEDKFFLKKHKKAIIDINFLDKFQTQYIACELLLSRKIIYLIDFTEKKRRKIVLYRVHLTYLCPAYE